MDEASFWHLHRLIGHKLGGDLYPRKNSKKRWRNGAPNGLIKSESRLSQALRFFAGGSVYDIGIAHGVHPNEVYTSAWRVVDAVAQTDCLKIKFPSDHNIQRKIAADFQKRSKATFGICAGAIDGMLLWIEKPKLIDCKNSKCGPKKFFCGRKKKFGINLQGTCDSVGRFLDVSICHPGSTSDYLAFGTSTLKHLLERPGFLAPGLALFGDNAYVNNSYMVTPFKGASAGDKDNFNFYQSQVSTASVRLLCR